MVEGSGSWIRGRIIREGGNGEMVTGGVIVFKRVLCWL